MIGRAFRFAFGWLWWCLLPVRKGVAMENYRAAFPDRDVGELRKTVGEVAWGYLQLLWGARGRVEGAELAAKGGIILGGHFASWDLALVSLGDHVPVTIFIKEPSNKLAAALITHIRGQSDVELLPPANSMAAAYAALERGRLVMFVQDQRHNKGIEVPFLGRPALTSAAFAAMAWRTRAPLFGMHQWRGEDGKLHQKVFPLDTAIAEDRDAAIAALTQASQEFYAEGIRRRPWSWWWLHDRWKHARPAGG